MVTHVFPLAVIVEGRTEAMNGMEQWAGLCAFLCLAVNFSTLRSA